MEQARATLMDFGRLAPVWEFPHFGHRKAVKPLFESSQTACPKRSEVLENAIELATQALTMAILQDGLSTRNRDIRTQAFAQLPSFLRIMGQGSLGRATHVLGAISRL